MKLKEILTSTIEELKREVNSFKIDSTDFKTEGQDRLREFREVLIKVEPKVVMFYLNNFEGLDANGVREFGGALAKIKSISFLFNKLGNLGEAGIQALTEVLANSEAQRLILCDNFTDLGEAGLRAFAHGLARFRMQFFSFSIPNGFVKLSEAGIMVLADGLANSQVQDLQFKNNNLGALNETCIRAFAKSLANFQGESLDLSDNNLGDLSEAGILAFAVELANFRVKIIYLGGNRFGALSEASLIALANGLANSRVQTFGIEGNDLSAKQQEIFQTAIQTRKQRIIEDKQRAKTLLLSYSRLQSDSIRQRTPETVSLGDLRRHLIYKILDDAGITLHAEEGKPKIAKSLLTLTTAYCARVTGIII